MPKTCNKNKRGKQTRRRIGGARLGNISYEGIFGSGNNSNQSNQHNQHNQHNQPNQSNQPNQQLNNGPFKAIFAPQSQSNQQTNQLVLAQEGKSSPFSFPSTQQTPQLDMMQMGMRPSAPRPMFPPQPSILPTPPPTSVNQNNMRAQSPLTTHTYPNNGNVKIDMMQMGMQPSAPRPMFPPQPSILPTPPPTSTRVGGSRKYKKRNKSRRKKNKRKNKRKTKRRR